MPKKRAWGEPDEGYSRDRLYTGGTDRQGHSGKARDIKLQPWLHDIIVRVAEEMPGYQGQVGAFMRNAAHHQALYDIERLENPDLKEKLRREFQLHADMEEQARQLSRFAEMQRYVSSCRAVLPVYTESGNWMLVTQQVEQMKKRVTDGLLWEPCASEIEQLVSEYGSKLKQAGKQASG